LKVLVVQGGAGLDIVGDVGDVDPQLEAVGGLVQADGVVDVLGLGAVDGKDGQGPQVHPALGVGLGDGGPFQLFGLLPHLVGEADVDVPGVEQGFGAALGRLA